jgi:hypothetical protein
MIFRKREVDTKNKEKRKYDTNISEKFYTEKQDYNQKF